jgi:hypothetical protein
MKNIDLRMKNFGAATAFRGKGQIRRSSPILSSEILILN